MQKTTSFKIGTLLSFVAFFAGCVGFILSLLDIFLVKMNVLDSSDLLISIALLVAGFLILKFRR